MTEIWRPVYSFEGLYEVSDLGRVRRVGKAARNGKGRGGGAVIGKIRTTHVTPFGYVQVQLYREGKPENRQVHRLVAEAFIGPREAGFEPNHKDGDKTNNAPSNLEWLTRSDNMIHAYATGLRKPANLPSGEAHHKAKLSDDQVRQIRQLFKPRVYAGPRLALEFGVTTFTIYSIVKHKTRKGASA
jgi:hypothetical protein